jgi:hypothetical protein
MGTGGCMGECSTLVGIIGRKHPAFCYKYRRTPFGARFGVRFGVRSDERRTGFGGTGAR